LGYVGIELRGFTSLTFKMKQYDIELRDSLGDDVSVSLLGMPKESDWVLNGSYTDKSLIRNVLLYNLSRQSGLCSPRTRFCELLIDGDYKGIYVLVEKVKRDNYRVDISKLDLDDNAADSLTGGYIVKFDRKSNDSYVYLSNANVGAQLVYTKNKNVTKEQFDYIKSYFYQFDKSLSQEELIVADFSPSLNINSFVDYFIFSELSKNIDSYRLSTYLYKDMDSKGGEIFMGPLWDYNLAFGNADYADVFTYEGLIAYNSVWFAKFLSDPDFCNLIKERWIELRNSTLKVYSILSTVDSISTIVKPAIKDNFARWDILGNYIWPNYFVGETYEEEISYLKDFLISRIAWLDVNLPGYSDVQIEYNFGFELVNTVVEDFITFKLEFSIPSKINCYLYDVTGNMVCSIYSNVWFDAGLYTEKYIDYELQTLHKGMYIMIFIVDGRGVYNQLVYKK
jgi:hypothetical protein